MINFLLSYDRRSGDLEVVEFRGEGSRARALRARLSAETRSSQGEKEVVVIAADSIEDLRRTHARYFKSVPELARTYS